VSLQRAAADDDFCFAATAEQSDGFTVPPPAASSLPHASSDNPVSPTHVKF
jgi:hypothetical protein